MPAGAQNVLYYEDGSLTGESAYAAALEPEIQSGLVQNVVRAGSPGEFNDLLLQSWDLIVFARQLDPTPQVYDTRLTSTLCRVRKGLVTDLFAPAAGPNPLFACMSIGIEPGSYQLLVGDDRLVEGNLPLVQRPIRPSTSTSSSDSRPNCLPAQGWAAQGFPIIGSGSQCGDQNAFYTTHTAGVGRVEAANIRPRTLVGQKILATFQMTELNLTARRLGWAAQARVELRRPGENGVLTVYPLYDDGTHGDKAIGNNTWTALIPDPALVPGPHRLRGIFELTLGGQTVHREAEYSVIVERVPDPDQCLHVTCYDTFEVAPGWQLKLGPCLGNMCLEETAYVVVAEASEGWLCADDGSGNLVPVGTQYQFTTP